MIRSRGKRIKLSCGVGYVTHWIPQYTQWTTCWIQLHKGVLVWPPTHHSWSHYHLVNFAFHSRCKPSVSNHRWHLSPPTLTCPHSLLHCLLFWMVEVFKLIHVHYLCSFRLSLYMIKLFIDLLFRAYLHLSKITSTCFDPLTTDCSVICKHQCIFIKYSHLIKDAKCIAFSPWPWHYPRTIVWC